MNGLQQQLLLREPIRILLTWVQISLVKLKFIEVEVEAEDPYAFDDSHLAPQV